MLQSNILSWNQLFEHIYGSTDCVKNKLMKIFMTATVVEICLYHVCVSYFSDILVDMHDCTYIFAISQDQIRSIALTFIVICQTFGIILVRANSIIGPPAGCISETLPLIILSYNINKWFNNKCNNVRLSFLQNVKPEATSSLVTSLRKDKKDKRLVLLKDENSLISYHMINTEYVNHHLPKQR